MGHPKFCNGLGNQSWLGLLAYIILQIYRYPARNSGMIDIDDYDYDDDDDDDEEDEEEDDR